MIEEKLQGAVESSSHTLAADVSRSPEKNRTVYAGKNSVAITRRPNTNLYIRVYIL